MANKRRGNGEGSIFLRKTCLNCKKVSTGEPKNLKVCRYCMATLPDEGRWEGRASIGHDPTTGKLIRLSFYGKSKKEVIDQLVQTMHEVRTGTYIQPTKMTLGEWLDKWLTAYKQGQLKTSTYESYESLINVHIKPDLGKVTLSKLQANTIQSFYNDKLKKGRKDKKEGGLSTRRVRYLHAIIRQALDQAVKEGMLHRNIADATSPPVIKNKQMQPLTESELLRFLDVAKEDRLYAAYVMAATTGLRRGELLGLCWDCVDFDNGMITVKRQLLIFKKGLELTDTTKTKNGRRSLTLTDDAIRELKAYKKRQAQERLLMGEAYQDNGLVFCKEDGSFLRPEEFTRRFQKWLEKAGLPKVRLHDLRHGHATMLLQRGIPAKLVQERLGHSSITMTLDLYSHVTPEMARLASESLNGLLSKEKSSVKVQSE